LARVSAFQAEGCGFETRLPLHVSVLALGPKRADIAQSVEHFLGKEEVMGSNPIVSSIFCRDL
jgi:hypothetical protein